MPKIPHRCWAGAVVVILLEGEEPLAFGLVVLRVVEFVLGRLEVGAGRRPLLFDLGLHLLFKFAKTNKINFFQGTPLSSTPPLPIGIFSFIHQFLFMNRW